MKSLRRYICAILIFTHVFPLTVSAQEENRGVDPLTVPQPAVFSVTIPTTLPVSVDEYGNVYTSTSATIKNNGNDIVEVVDMTLTPTGIHRCVGYDENFYSKNIDSNQFAMMVKGSKTNSDGSFVFDKSQFAPINPGESCYIPYNVKITPSSTQQTNIHIADVCFTIDWYKKVALTYNANGGVFASGEEINPIEYTNSGYWISGQEEIPVRNHCTFDGWFADAALSTSFTPFIPKEDVNAWARWLTTYKVVHKLQSLDHSYIYNTKETETFTAYVGDVVAPEIKYYDHYKQPTRQTMTIDDSGNCVITYIYDRTTFWVDVNFIINGVETGGPADKSWPYGLTESFLNVFIDDVQVGWGQDFCQIHPYMARYKITMNLPERYYYVGPYLEGADYWDNGTTLYRCQDSGVITENIGARLIINLATDATPFYTINFDANGGNGTMTPMKMSFENGQHEINWLYWNAFTRDGYYFAGWSLTPDGDSVDFADNARVTRLSNVNGDVITLYAKWVPN